MIFAGHIPRACERGLEDEAASVGRPLGGHTPTTRCSIESSSGEKAWPILLSTLYIEVARRAGIALAGLPGHFVVGHLATVG